MNQVPSLSVAGCFCYALLKPVWHDALQRHTIFSIPQCVTPSVPDFIMANLPVHTVGKFCRSLERKKAYTYTPIKTKRHLSSERKSTGVQWVSLTYLLASFNMLYWKTFWKHRFFSCKRSRPNILLSTMNQSAALIIITTIRNRRVGVL